MSDYPATPKFAPPVATLEATSAGGVSHALSYVLAALLVAVTVSGLLLLVLSAR
jgi:hypothetical protein